MMKLYQVFAWDTEENKGPNDRSRFVCANSPEEAFELWQVDILVENGTDDLGPIEFLFVAEVPAQESEAGVVYPDIVLKPVDD